MTTGVRHGASTPGGAEIPRIRAERRIHLRSFRFALRCGVLACAVLPAWNAGGEGVLPGGGPLALHSLALLALAGFLVCGLLALGHVLVAPRPARD